MAISEGRCSVGKCRRKAIHYFHKKSYCIKCWNKKIKEIKNDNLDPLSEMQS